MSPQGAFLRLSDLLRRMPGLSFPHHVQLAGENRISAVDAPSFGATVWPLSALEHFQFETLRVSNHTACRFAEKVRFFRSLRAGRRCAAASRFTFFQS